MTRHYARKAHLLCLSVFIVIVSLLELSVARAGENVLARGGSEIPTKPAKASQVAKPAAALDSSTPLFLPAVTYSTGGSDSIFFNDSTWVSLVDVDGDGKPDILVANWCSTFKASACPAGANIGVLLGNGDGTFQPVVTYASGGYYAFSIVAEDVNGDGKLDLLVANGCLVGVSTVCPSSGSVGVLLGNGDGTFQPVKNYPTAGVLSWMTVADVNGDKKLDLIVTNRDGGSNGEGSAGVLLGNGDGTFQPVQLYSSGGLNPDFITLADVNADGHLDLLVSNPNSCNNCTGNVGVLLGVGDGTFLAASHYTSGFGANVTLLADLNGDKKVDLVINAGGSFDGGAVIVMLGNGDGSFQPPVVYSSGGDYNTSPILMDLNGDHNLDLVEVNAQFCSASDGSACVGVLIGNGDGTFQPPVQYALTGVGAGQLVAGDLNGDGKTDLLAISQCGKTCNKGHGLVEALLGNGDGTFQPVTTYDSGGYASSWIGVADLNGDGRLDAVAVNALQGGEDSLSVLLNNSVGLPLTTTTLVSSLNPSNLGDAVTLTAAVGSAAGMPTGTVVFYDGSNSLGSAALAAGSTSLSTSSLTAGSHSITAAYQGSSSFAPSNSAVLNQVVNATAQSTTTTLNSRPNPSVFLEPVTLTAGVTNVAGGLPVGTVVFYSGTTVIGSSALAGGSASMVTRSLPPGSDSLTAAYQGATGFDPSTSAVLTQAVTHVGKFRTVMTMGGAGRYFAGQPVTISARLTSKGGSIPDGETVSFFADGLIGTGLTHNGVASITTTTLPARGYVVSGEYRGDSMFTRAGTSITIDVVRYPTITTLAASPNPVIYGQPVTYTATVTSSGPDVPTGYVRLPEIGPVPLVGGVATFTKKDVRVGTHAFTAEYLEDSESARSTSAVLEVVSQPAPTTASISSSANPSSSGQAVTFTATVTPSTPVNSYGKVTFTAGTTTIGTATLKDNTASITTLALPAGPTSITVTYDGTPSFVGSSASLTQNVQP